MVVSVTEEYLGALINFSIVKLQEQEKEITRKNGIIDTMTEDKQKLVKERDSLKNELEKLKKAEK